MIPVGGTLLYGPTASYMRFVVSSHSLLMNVWLLLLLGILTKTLGICLFPTDVFRYESMLFRTYEF